MNKKKLRPSNIYLAVILILMYLPILTVIVYSFNDSKLSTIWTGFSLSWYQKLFSDTVMMDALKNSLILALLSCSISAVIGTVGAVGLVRSNLRGKTAIETLSTIPIMIPEIILGMMFLAFFSFLGFRFGMFTLVLAHCSFCIPYIFMMVKGSLASLDTSIEDAARDLGASGIRTFFDMILPQILPSVLSGSLLAFAMSLDDVVISFFVTGASVNTLPIKIYSQLKMGVTPEVNALCTLMLVVTFIIIIISSLIGRKSIKKERIL